VLVLPGADHPPTCNLLAPIVINTRTLVAKQILQVESDYPSVFPLTAG
jgi:flagellar assembly factor FliW